MKKTKTASESGRVFSLLVLQRVLVSYLSFIFKPPSFVDIVLLKRETFLLRYGCNCCPPSPNLPPDRAVTFVVVTVRVGGLD